ncbi:unnamed protein product, partial [Sphacelaria rigidula]
PAGYVPSFDKGHFVFFLGDKAPFLVGRVTDKREGTDGEAGEVQVRWWSPATSAIRNNASAYNIGEYGKGKITADYKTVGNSEGCTMGSKSKRRKLVPDVE